MKENKDGLVFKLLERFFNSLGDTTIKAKGNSTTTPRSDGSVEKTFNMDININKDDK